MSNNKRRKDSGNHKSLTGKIEITRNGMAYVIVDGHDKDILIRRGNTANALNGDTVRVEVSGYNDNGKRQEGTVKEVVARKQNEFTGMLQVKEHFAFFLPDSEKVPFDFYIPLDMLGGAKDGDHVVAKIVEWTPKAKNPVGEVMGILTEESRNEKAMQTILMENGFSLNFPDEVLEEAARYPDVIDSAEIKKRKDLRNILTITIDPEDAKDFDDAISFRLLKDGWYEVGVHIADVSHFIAPDSALDKEAFKRATSVYLPDRVLPMLPERLSNELCSLRPNEDKYTFSAIFVMNKQGEVKDTFIGRTLIHSVRRYSYEEVQTIIEGAEGDHQDVILLLNEMAQNLRKERFKRGAINFSSQEVRFKLDATGKPIAIVIKESKEAHQLIEEMMLMANKAVAEYVSGLSKDDKPIPFPYRVHDVPDEDKLKVFSLFAMKFGVKLDVSTPENIATSFNAMLQKVRGTPEQHVLEQLGIRTMSKAVYTTDNIGHYGLGFEHYCHFTSPIRRYPDVLVHRIIQQCLDGKLSPAKHMETMCRHCSDQERRAMEAERTANKYKQVEYMQSYLGEDFDAVVSGVATFGFWAETVAHKCEGMVSITDLADIDHFEYREGEYALVGKHTGMRITMGNELRVRVAATNLEKRRIDYAFLEMTSIKGNIIQTDPVRNTGRKTTKEKRNKKH